MGTFVVVVLDELRQDGHEMAVVEEAEFEHPAG
jgi:hypothetical protein